MQIVKIGNKSYGVALDWHLLQKGGPTGKEIKLLCKDTGMKFGCKISLKINDEKLDVVGLSSEKTSAIPGAALLAEANRIHLGDGSSGDESPDWLLVEKIDGSDYWLCAIKDGVPAPGMDMVGNYDYVTSYIADILDAGSFTVFSTDDRIREYIGEMYSSEDKDFESLISGLKSKVKIEQLEGIPTEAIAVFGGIAIVTILGGGGYFMWQEQEAKRIQEEARAKAARDLEASKNNQKINDQQLQAAAEAAIAQKKFLILSDVNNFDVVSERIRSLIYKVDYVYGGWRADNINCAIDSSKCTLTLKRDAMMLGTRNSILSIFPNAVITADDAVVDFAITKHNFPADYKFTDNIASDDNFANNYISYMQGLFNAGITHSFENSVAVQQTVTRPAPPVPCSNPTGNCPPPPPITGQVDVGYKTGKLSLVGSGVDKYADLVNTLGSTKSIVIKNVSFKIDSSDWKLDGEYYTRASKK